MSVAGHDDVQLLNFHQLPGHLQTNPYIKAGYRPMTDWRGSVRSLRYIHTETVNIVSHALPASLIIAFLPNLLPWSQLVNVSLLPYIHILSCLAPFLGSVIYHTFLNHKGGADIYDALLYLDLFGIWISQALGTIAPLAAAIHCYSDVAKILLWSGYFTACWISLRQALTASNIWERRICFLPSFFCRLVVITLRSFGWATGHPQSLTFLIKQDILVVIGALIGALKVPERWLPNGSCDLLGHSHQLMHVLVVVAAWYIHSAVKRDLIWISRINSGLELCAL